MNQTLLAFNAAAAAATLLGGLAPAVQRLLSRRALRRMFSLRSGILLAVVLVGVLPEAWRLHPARCGWGALLAFALLFCLESYAMTDCCPEYLEECSVHLLGWGALAALFLHSLFDGFNLSVSCLAGRTAGAAVGAALVLHKLADGFTLTTLLSQGGYARGAVLAALALISAATPLGSLLAAAGLRGVPPALSASLLGFTGGALLYIGSADILPRLHKDRDPGSIAFFLVGMSAMAILAGVG